MAARSVGGRSVRLIESSAVELTPGEPLQVVPSPEERAGGIPTPIRLLHPERPRPGHQLPVQLTSFIGREREAVEVQRLLVGEPASPRLVTLTGAGGCG